MSREIFLLPSAKQILSYENGDIRSDEITTIYRFNFLRTYLWIEPSKKGYDIKLRGRMPSTNDYLFIANSRTVSVCSDLFSAVTIFACMVKDLIDMYNVDVKDSFRSDFNLTTEDQ